MVEIGFIVSAVSLLVLVYALSMRRAALWDDLTAREHRVLEAERALLDGERRLFEQQRRSWHEQRVAE